MSEDRRNLVLAKDIARQTGIPRAYLSKILHSLTRAGLIASKRGYRGGVALSRPRTAISLMDIVEAVEEKTGNPAAPGIDRLLDDRACPLHEFWKIERGRIEDQLRHTTLGEIAEFESTWLSAALPVSAE
jgi:Rrf2 family protein